MPLRKQCEAYRRKEKARTACDTSELSLGQVIRRKAPHAGSMIVCTPLASPFSSGRQPSCRPHLARPSAKGLQVAPSGHRGCPRCSRCRWTGGWCLVDALVSRALHRLLGVRGKRPGESRGSLRRPRWPTERTVQINNEHTRAASLPPLMSKVKMGPAPFGKYFSYRS